MKKLYILLLAALSMTACMKHGTEQPSKVSVGSGVFVLCEGGFGQGNSSLSFYNPASKSVTNDIFNTANDAKLGDTAQSIVVRGGKTYIVVNNSGVVYAVDSRTLAVSGKIENLTSPRYICFASDTKAYISDISTAKLTVFNPKTMTVTGQIALSGVANAEEMVIANGKLFAASWSNGYKVAVVNLSNDVCEQTIEVGVQPFSIALDKNKTLWVLCDGGNSYSQLPDGKVPENPSLWKINTTSLEATKFQTFAAGSYFASHIALNGAADKLYFINGSVWEFDTSTNTFPTSPLITLSGWSYYGLGVNPSNDDIYIADAKDYKSNGAVIRYSSKGDKIDEFEVGLLPSKFAFK